MISTKQYEQHWRDYERQQRYKERQKRRLDCQGEREPTSFSVVNEISGDYVEYEYVPEDQLLYITYWLTHEDGRDDEIADQEWYQFYTNPIPELMVESGLPHLPGTLEDQGS